MARSILSAPQSGTAAHAPSSPPDPAGRPRRFRSTTPPPLWRELLLITVFYGVYMVIRLVVSPIGTASAFAHADQVLSVERALGLDIELGLNRTLLELPWLARTANIFYTTAHFVVTLSVLIWLYRRRPGHYRWLRTALMVATLAALTGFWLYPLAPPRFLPGYGFIDPVTALHTFGLYSAPGSGDLTNQYAAMPSMHAGWALWCGLVLVRLASERWVRVLGVLYPVATVLVILATANHYTLDAVVGAVLVIAALSGSRLLLRDDPPVGRPIDRPIDRRIGGRIGGPIRWPIGPPIDRPIFWPIGPPINRPIFWSIFWQTSRQTGRQTGRQIRWRLNRQASRWSPRRRPARRRHAPGARAGGSPPEDHPSRDSRAPGSPRTALCGDRSEGCPTGVPARA
jgi:PAP2 superfamily protein